MKPLKVKKRQGEFQRKTDLRDVLFWLPPTADTFIFRVLLQPLWLCLLGFSEQIYFISPQRRASYSFLFFEDHCNFSPLEHQQVVFNVIKHPSSKPTPHFLFLACLKRLKFGCLCGAFSTMLWHHQSYEISTEKVVSVVALLVHARDPRVVETLAMHACGLVRVTLPLAIKSFVLKNLVADCVTYF